MSDQDQNPTKEELAWVDAVGEQLRRSEHDLPGDVMQQLHTARRVAVHAAGHPGDGTFNFPPKRWYTAAASGSVLAAALVLVLTSSPAVLEIPNLDDQELAAAQEVELLEELEFVAWMVAMEESDEQPSQG